MRLNMPARSNARVPTAFAASRPARLANERTFLAWLRVAFALLALGLVIRSSTSPASASSGRMLADGCLAAAPGPVVIATVRWWASDRAMARSAHLPRGVAYAVLAAAALVLAVLVDLIVQR